MKVGGRKRMRSGLEGSGDPGVTVEGTRSCPDRLEDSGGRYVLHQCKASAESYLGEEGPEYFAGALDSQAGAAPPPERGDDDHDEESQDSPSTFTFT